MILPQPRNVPPLLVRVVADLGTATSLVQALPAAVTLTAWSRPTLLLPPIPETLRDRWILVRWVAADAAGDPPDGQSPAVLAGPDARVELPSVAPGTYQVSARAIDRTEPHASTAWFPLATIWLRSGATSVPLPAAALDALAAAPRP